MSIIGNPITQVAFLTDQFSGTGSQTAYTLSVAPANTASMLVAVSGVLQDPSTYAISGTTLTFTVAPPLGTANISVRYLGIPATGVTTTAYRTVTEFTATANQTSFTPPTYTVGFLDVYRNGVRLASADFTASNGTTVTLATGASAGDIVTTESYYVSSVLNAIPAIANSITSSYMGPGSVSQIALDTTSSTGTGAVLIPTGTTAQRPVSPVTGQTRFNTTTGTVEYYNGGWVVLTPAYQASILIVGGGGSGGVGTGSGFGQTGGGGAGGLVYYASQTLIGTTQYTVTVGGGASGFSGGGSTAGYHGLTGNNSSFGALTTAYGGGGGAGNINGVTSNGYSGGSGGGAAATSGNGDPGPTYQQGGSGISGQGNAGGTTTGQAGNYGGGGGGAGAAGNGVNGNGGVGLQYSINNSATYYAGGGGAGGTSQTSGGTGGGGSGTASNASYAGNGTSYTGGGGGGGFNGSTGSFSAYGGSGNGGSGVVILSYVSSAQRGTGGTVTSYTSGGQTYWVHTFTTSGAYTA